MGVRKHGHRAPKNSPVSPKRKAALHLEVPAPNKEAGTCLISNMRLQQQVYLASCPMHLGCELPLAWACIAQATFDAGLMLISKAD